MRRILLPMILAVALSACGKNNDEKNGSTNNDATNNASTNNDATTNADNSGSNNSGSNNGGTNNVGNSATNNGTINNASTNNDATNNASTNNQTNNSTNNQTVGPYTSCEEGGLTECFSNSDCASDERCQDVGGSVEVPCCVVGERGSGMVGDMCDDENDCSTGICIQRNDDPYICSKPCEGPDDCPDPLECETTVLGLCVTPG